MPPRWAPSAYRSCGASLMRRPGMRNERGTHVGANLRMPCPASSACRTMAGVVCGMADGAAGLLGFFVGLVGLGLRFTGAVFLAMRLLGWTGPVPSEGTGAVVGMLDCGAYSPPPTRKQG